MDGAYRFGAFELQPSSRLLLKDGAPVKLGGRAFDLLLTLVERRDRVVPKSELLDLVWPHLVVEENNLQVHVMALRKLLGPRAIATVPGRGYRFATVIDRDTHGGTVPASPSAPAGSASPRQTATLIGRDNDLQALRDTLGTQRLVTLLGAGGVGKSSLARELADQLAPRFADGAVWVDLTPVPDAAGVVDAIAAATRVSLPRGDRHKALAAALAPLQMLLVLDNAEHVVDGVTQVTKAVHEQAAALHLLVTSQAPLRLAAEQLHRLEPLALADPDAGTAEAEASPAVQLFVARVRASDRHFVLDAHNVHAVVRLTRRLDGLPLAIEMAAARVPALTPAQLDEALRERFRLLTTGDRAAPARQHTLQAALQWTHGLLAPAEHAVFRRLSVFVGSFSLAAAQQVCSDGPDIDEWQVLDALAVLVDRSLVTPPRGEPPRYRLLDTPQAYARQLLAASTEEARVRARHLAVHRLLFETAYEDHLWARRPVLQQRERTNADGDNGLAALSWALAHDTVASLALAPGLAQALTHRHTERFAVLRQTEALLQEDMPAAVRARWQLNYAQFWGHNNPQRSRPHARAAADLFRAEGHAAGEYRALAVVASMLAGASTEGSAEALARMLELEDPAWPAELRFVRHYVQATQLSAAGRFDEALAAGERSMALIRESGRRGRLVHELSMMYLEIMAGRHDDAIQRGLAAMQRLRERVRQGPASGVELLLLGAWLLKGDTAPAEAMAPAVWAAACAFDMQAPTADVLSLLAMHQNRPRAAALLQGYAEAMYRRSGAQRLEMYQRIGEQALAQTAARLGAPELSALVARGRTLPEPSITALAFAAADAPD